MIRHDAAHVLAAAVKELYPGVKISIGPPIDDGFYYDFDFPDGIKVGEDDLARIEQKMREHIKADEKFERTDISSAEALERFSRENEDYKVELIEDLADGLGVALPERTVHRPLPRPARAGHQAHQGDQAHLGRRRLLARRLEPPDAHAHLRHGLLLQGQLDEHLQRIEEAKARDHRKLGRELGLFDWDPVSPGSTVLAPEGHRAVQPARRAQPRDAGGARLCRGEDAAALRVDALGDLRALGQVQGEHLRHRLRGARVRLKPMNCPGHCKLFSLQRWSYRDLPFRCAEPGLLHRREPSGTLHGLLRVRHFAQDDAHIFCTEDQVAEEVERCMAFAQHRFGQRRQRQGPYC